MYLFIYGTMRKGEGDSYYSNPAALVKERVWTNAVLVDTGKGFAALAPGNKWVTGELYFVEEQLNVIKGLIEH
ncbi:gamma-glutamylcyclotransferase [Aneurinibacillus tyrosinisolvens]|uniref:gamma-glutamylcyclotransferase n=1 Tax=Aneurinibacillus tyrosinisolvens TaxID=1443435 RepID=UPI00063F0F2D|nr:gamma-glutamylcyclotransferase [Aneurinibacillus tyrosinisolvens]